LTDCVVFCGLFMTVKQAQPCVSSRPVERVLASYWPLRPEEIEVVRASLTDVRAHASGRPISGLDGGGEAHVRIVLSGWIAWMTQFADGRRQIVSLALPGDLLEGAPSGDLGVVHASLVPAQTADARGLLAAIARATDGGGLAASWRLARMAADAWRVRQVLRLGRLSAYERTACLMLELHERQSRAGLCDEHSMPLPLTQEMLADILGLSVVHMNRILQQLRRDELIVFRGGRVVFPDPETLAQTALRA
jgi:CRP-like cAMP-binding protein